MNRKERSRFETWLLVLTGLYHTYDQWTRVLLPFAQWQLEPHPSITVMLGLNSLGSAFTFFGTFFIAEMIDVWGMRTSALLIAIFVAVYQIIICSTTDVWVYGALQSILMFNNMQMVVDAGILHLEGEHGDAKKRSRLVTKMLIPMSVGYAAGPYCALQMVSGPYISYDNIVRISMASTVVHDPQMIHQLVGLTDKQHKSSRNKFFMLGLTTMTVNAIVLPRIQALWSPQTLLIGSFSLLSLSYSYMAMFHDYSHLLVGMPIQVFAVSICIGEISSQLMGNVGKEYAGKATALIRMSQLGASMLTPLVAGAYLTESDTTPLCITNALISLAAIPLVHKYADFMKFDIALLTVHSVKME
ncbi:unnamed protein product [Caenorhabditis auriculariae]|uniref:Uncharacterized protein n=1 Tax=Caenorhabditis auriculariae TaxID=2777116 RepID=A0A8S1GML7_9PELO|nr:unnamed protein product [Caenorhabditis auriculariae]